MDNNKETLQRFLECAARGDRAGQEELLDDDICVSEAASLPFGGVHRGKEAFFGLVKRVFTQWDDVRIDIEHIISEGDKVVVLVAFQGRSPRSGEPFRMPLAEVWHFRDGKIAEIQPFYHDTKRLLDL